MEPSESEPQFRLTPHFLTYRCLATTHAAKKRRKILFSDAAKFVTENATIQETGRYLPTRLRSSMHCATADRSMRFSKSAVLCWCESDNTMKSAIAQDQLSWNWKRATCDEDGILSLNWKRRRSRPSSHSILTVALPAPCAHRSLLD